VLLATHVAEKKVIAALGAGCLALMRLGAGKGKKIATSPHLAKQMKALNVDKEWNLIEIEPVVIDGKTIKISHRHN
jgi:putative intracellular protease/amidase